MSQWMSVASTTARIPTDGKGGSALPSTFTAANIFVAPGAVPTAGTFPKGPFVASAIANNLTASIGWGGAALAPAVGDIISTVTSNFWGIITKVTASMFAFGGVTYDCIEVDRWRKFGVIGSNGTPTAGDDMNAYHLQYSNQEKWVIDWIDFTGNNQITAQALTICDLNGVAIPGLTFQNQAQVAANLVYQPTLHHFAAGGHGPLGHTSIELDQPFTVKTANAGATATVGFRVT